MLNMRTTMLGTVMLALTAAMFSAPAYGVPGRSKYYFRVSNIECRNDKIIPLAKELLEAEVATRPEFTTDLGGKSGEDAQSVLRKYDEARFGKQP